MVSRLSFMSGIGNSIPKVIIVTVSKSIFLLEFHISEWVFLYKLNIDIAVIAGHI